MVVMEPTRNAWVPLAAWFRRRGAGWSSSHPEQSSDLRDYFSKHTKTDRLDAELLARLPVLHPEGLHRAEALGPGRPLNRAVKIRAGLVHRRSTAMHRLDSLLEILGPGWTDALGTRMTQTTYPVPGRLRPPSPGQTARAGPLGALVPAPHPQGVGSRRRVSSCLCKRPGSWWSEVGVDAVGVDECELFEGLLPVRGDLALDEAAGGLALCGR